MYVIKVLNETRSVLVGDHIEIADTALSRLIGLLGRRSLVAGGGIWIKPSSGVHTMGMLFPIDVVGLDKSLTVIKLWNNLAPFRVTPIIWKMQSVIELPSGQIAETGIQVGDSLSVV